jgi:hypothetical protein
MRTKSAIPWEIPSRGRTCARAGETLAAGMTVYSELRVASDAYCQRRDFCALCWDLEQCERDVSSALTYWRSVIPEGPGAVCYGQQRCAQLLLWLREALTHADDVSHREAFVLALYLTRLQKLVRRQSIFHEQRACTVYEVVESGDVLLVPAVTMQSTEINQLQQTLTARFQALK